MWVQQLFQWKWSGALIAFFYGTGFGLWSIALSTDPYEYLFCAASISFFLGAGWCVGWLLTNDVFGQEASQPSGRRKQRQYNLNIRQRRNIKIVLTALCLMPLAVVESWLWTSFHAHRAEKALGSVEVYIGDTLRLTTLVVPYRDTPDNLEEMKQELSTIPIKNVTIPASENSAVLSVIVRNTSEITIKNLHVDVSSLEPIEAAGGNIGTFSPTEVSTDVRELRPFSVHTRELFISIRVFFPQRVNEEFLNVSIDADNLKPYACGARIVFTKQ